MFASYLKVALRSLLRQPGYTLLNILGLALAVACTIPIGLFIQDELRWATYHSQRDHVYRVIRETTPPGGERQMKTNTSGAISTALPDESPQVEATARLIAWGQDIRYGDQRYHEWTAVTDPGFLVMFDVNVVRGDAATVLSEPLTMMVSEDVVERIFDGADPLGEVMTIQGAAFGGDYTITGVYEDFGDHAFIRPTVITSGVPPGASGTFVNIWNNWITESEFRPANNWVMIRAGEDPAEVVAALERLKERHMPPEVAARTAYHLQRLDRLQLYSQADFGIGRAGIEFVYQLLAIGAVVVLIACFNFTNLATARATMRAREVGVRKTLGGRRSQLALQFLTEALITAFAAVLVGLVINIWALDWFGEYVGRPMRLAEAGLAGVGVLLAFALFAAVAAGAYPALVLSGFQPAQTLKGSGTQLHGRAQLRRWLIVGQFCASIVMVAVTGVVQRQLDYVGSRDLGYDRDHMVITRIFDDELRRQRRYEEVKKAMLEHPGVLRAAAMWPNPVIGGERWTVKPEGAAEREYEMEVMGGDPDFLETFGIELLEGRNFVEGRESDLLGAYLLNETAVRMLGWDEPIGKGFSWVGRDGVVIGVVRDFHTQSLHEPVQPVFIAQWNYLELAMKISPHDVPATIEHIGEVWRRYRPDADLDYAFVDESLRWDYQNETRLREACTLFTGMAMFVACLGLFGLASYTTQQRTKEIGVRKVLGSGVGRIVALLTRDVIGVVVIASIAGVPLAWMLSERWLSEFAFRADLGAAPFVTATASVLLVALLSVILQVVRAALRNPVESLRYE